MFQNISITNEQFQASNWKAIIAGEKEKTYRHYCQLFSEAQKKAKEDHNNINLEIYTLLGAACSLYINLSSKDEPLSPMLVMTTGRSIIVSDFSEQQISNFSDWTDFIDDPELKARLADICWLRKNDYKKAINAIDAYMDSSRNFISGDISWVYAVDRIERSLQIASSLGIGKEYFNKVISYIEEVLENKGWIDLSFFSLRLMNLLLNYHRGNFERYIQFSINSATYLESQDDFYKARAYWDIARQWCIISKDSSLEKRMQIHIAETYVKEAQISLLKTQPQYIEATSHIENAIQAFRRIAGMRDRIDELHHTLLKYEEKVNAEMSYFETAPLDLNDFAEKARNSVRGKSFDESLKILALCMPSPNKNELQKRTKEMMQEFPLRFLFTTQNINDKGKVSAKVPSASLHSEEENEIAILAEMYSQAKITQDISVVGIIEPIRTQINLDHPNIRFFDFFSFVTHNPFIPEGRELIYARGLYEGLKGDFLLSTSLLIPQLENSIRYFFETRGIITSSLDQNGIQKELSLNDLFEKPEAIEILGENLLFDLKGLLSESLGSNLRNLISHGLLDHNLFYSYTSVYLWWLTIRLIVLALLPDEVLKNQSRESDEKS